MFKEATPENPKDDVSTRLDDDVIDPSLIHQELRRILSSRHFQTSRRGKEFLQYVVNEKINGNGDLLKERLIGVQLFGRKPDYSTGEDPVVRVQAGDVRRRLERYHADAESQAEILIQVPLGSYAPVFRLSRKRPLQTPQPLPEDLHGLHFHDPHVVAGTVVSNAADELSRLSGETDGRQSATAPGAVPARDPKLPNRRVTLAKRTLVPALLGLVLIAYLITLYLHRRPESTLRAFWQPASYSSKPVLLCLPRPMVYKPSDKLFDQYAKMHPNALGTREARQDEILPMEPTDDIHWGDMIPVRSSGPGIGGVIAAINVSKMLTEQGIRFQLRFGKEASYAAMRDSPVVVVGGINTEWATQLISESSFAFDETRASPNIYETGGAKRVWRQETRDGRVSRDYGLITRQLSGRAGQFLVQIAGISHFGTAAASELLVQPQELDKLLRSQSIDLKKKELQIVVETDVTDERAGPPHVVAVSSW